MRAEVEVWRAREALAEVEREAAALRNGEAVPDGLLETPRKRTERLRRWTPEQRAERRRAARHRLLEAVRVREDAARQTLHSAERRAHAEAALPPLQLDTLRRPGVGARSDEFVAALPEGVNAEGPHGARALHLAVLQGHMAVVCDILAQPACEVDAADAAGQTALRLALGRGAEGLPVARLLLQEGADITHRGRDGLNPVQAALAKGLYQEMARLVEETPFASLLRAFARRFFLEYFEGEPNHHYYKDANYNDALLLAYLVAVQPPRMRALVRSVDSAGKGLLPRRHKRRVCANNLERLFHDSTGGLALDPGHGLSFDGLAAQRKVEAERKPVRRAATAVLRRASTMGRRSGKGQSRKPIAALGVRQPRAEPANPVFSLDGGDSDEERTEPRAEVFPFGFLREFQPAQVRAWAQQARRWAFASPAAAASVSERVFNGSLSPEDVVARGAEGRNAFERWRGANARVLAAEREQRLHAAADALRLRKLRQRRRARVEAQRIEAERQALEREKRGLHALDPDACVLISASALRYNVDEGVGPSYTIRLGTRPRAPVLLKLSASGPAAEEGEHKPCQFSIKPTLITFTAGNWDEPRTVDVRPLDDDAIVRLKRTAAMGPPDVCDHVVSHAIQSSTDVSYRNAELRWQPAQTLSLHVDA